jgi:hypothetical protein
MFCSERRSGRNTCLGADFLHDGVRVGFGTLFGMDLNMEVRGGTAGVTGIADITDDRSGFHFARGSVARKVGTEDLHAIRAVEIHRKSPATACFLHRSPRERREDWGTPGGQHIGSGVAAATRSALAPVVGEFCAGDWALPIERRCTERYLNRRSASVFIKIARFDHERCSIGRWQGRSGSNTRRDYYGCLRNRRDDDLCVDRLTNKRGHYTWSYDCLGSVGNGRSGLRRQASSSYDEGQTGQPANIAVGRVPRISAGADELAGGQFRRFALDGKRNGVRKEHHGT